MEELKTKVVRAIIVRRSSTVEGDAAAAIGAFSAWLEEQASDSRLAGLSYPCGLSGLVKQLKDME